MKVKRIVSIFTLLLILLIAPKAYAALPDGASVENFEGNIKLTGVLDTNIGMDCRRDPGSLNGSAYPTWLDGCGKSYKHRKGTFTLKSSGQTFPAFCVYPNASSGSGKVTCSLIKPEEMPNTYYVANHFYDLIESDHQQADLVFRITGTREKYGFGGANTDFDPNATSESQWGGEASFNATWNARVENDIYDSPYALEGFVLHDKRTYHNLDGQRDEPGPVHDAAMKMREAFQSGLDANYDSITASKGTGKIFEIEPIESTKNPEEGSMEYNVRTKNGKAYTYVDLKAVQGSAVWVSAWTGTSGRIKVSAKKVSGECKAIITLRPTNKAPTGNNNGGGGTSGGGGGSTPNPPPTCGSMQVWGYKKRLKQTCYSSSCSCGPGQCVANKDYTNDCHWDSTVRACDPNNSADYENVYGCYPWDDPNVTIVHDGTGAKKTASSNDNDDSIKGKVEIERDLIFDTGIAVNNENDDETLMLEGETGNSGVSTKVYWCQLTGSYKQQSYVVLVNDDLDMDTVELDLECGGDCYKDGCSPAAMPDDFTDTKVKNCCDDEGEAHGRQYALNELFCDYKDNGMQVPYYKEKCNTELYKDEEEINTYCVQYCSVAFYYTIPAPSHSKEDRYFEWSKKKTGVSGPELNQYRRCRTLIKYDVWYKAYADDVDALVSNYNSAEANFANRDMWIKMKADQESNKESFEAVTITCRYRATTTCAQGVIGPCYDYSSGSATVAATDIYTYPGDTYYNKADYVHPILKRLADEEDLKYTFSKIIKKNTAYASDKTKYYNKKQAEDYVTDFNNKIQSAKDSAKKDGYSYYDCSDSAPTFANTADPDDKIKTYNSKGEADLGSYQSMVTAIENLKKSLDDCGGKIEKGGGRDDEVLKERVKFSEEHEPEMEFSYAAKYLQEDGSYADQELAIPFAKGHPESKGDGKYKFVQTDDCAHSEYTGFKDEKVNGDLGNYYDPDFMEGSKYFGSYYDQKKYGANSQFLTDMIYDDTFTPVGNYIPLDKVAKTPECDDKSCPEYDKHINPEVYEADKKFTTDALTHMTCYWQDVGEEGLYTIIPNGIIVEARDAGQLCDLPEYTCLNYQDVYGNDYTNNGVWHTYKGHLAGKFETYFTLKNICYDDGLGKGLFDDFVHIEGDSCSGRNDLVNYNGTPTNATCYIEIQNELIGYEDCTGADIVSIEDEAGAICCKNPPCDNDFHRPEILFDYKIVDTTNMFPNKDQHDGGYAFNWLVDADGKKEYDEVKHDGDADLTYAPENITFSYTLTPRDLRAIREYNKTRVNKGGYNDFNMSCELEGHTMVKCKSKFLEAISGEGAITSDGVTLNLQANNTDLKTIRSNW